jgi:hypothetical protein
MTKQLLISYGVPAILALIVSLYWMAKKRGATVKIGVNIGIFLSKLIKGFIIKIISSIPFLSGYKAGMEDGTEFTLCDLCDGIKIGLRLDNKPPAERKKIKEALKAAGNDNEGIDKLKNILM